MTIGIVPLLLPVVELELQKERQSGCRSFWSVTGALTAVDVDGLPGDEGGVLQKQDRVHDIPDFTHVSHRMQAGKELVSFGSMHWRLDHAGSNGVDPNALLCILDRQGLRSGA